VNGKFSPAQKDLYQAILNVQRTCVALCRENANVSLDKLHNIAEHGLEGQLKRLGFDLSGGVSFLEYGNFGTKIFTRLLGFGNSFPSSCWPLYWP
jgi:Xaa-Pro aminopeptidase